MSRRPRPPFRKFADALLVGLLILYLLAGVQQVPFHGDESTIIAMSRDWFYFTSGRFDAVAYSAQPADPADQELRLINGVIGPYSIGIGAALIGLKGDSLNRQWLWGADWNYNRDNGHMPTEPLLFAGRLASALLTAMSIALVFAAGNLLGGSGVGALSAILYTLLPGLLLNTRRAMFEGATAFSIALVIAVGLLVAQHTARKGGVNRRMWLLFGLACGVGVASKHILIVTILPIALALLWLGRTQIKRVVVGLAAAGLLAAGTFFALNPAWWSAPLTVPGEVWRLRTALAAGQVQFYGGYTGLPDRLGMLFQAVIGPPQYYEDERGWRDWLHEQIAAYERSDLGGVAWTGIGLAALWLLSGIGMLLRLERSRRQTRILVQPTTIVFWSILLFSLVAIFALTPLPWQRYYLPLAAPFALAYSATLSGLAPLLRPLWRGRHAG